MGKFRALVLAIALPAVLVLPISAASAAASTPASATAAAHGSPGGTTAKNAAAAKTTQSAKTANSLAAKDAASPAITAPKPVDTVKAAPKSLAAKPIAPVQEHAPAAGSATATRTARANAAKSVLAHSDVADTCSGAIGADTVYPCDTPSASGTDSFTVALADTADLLVVQVLSTSGSELPFTLTAPDGTAVTCGGEAYLQIPQCPTSQSGTYTLAVSNQSSDYTISYSPLLSDPGCAVADPSFSAPTIQGTLVAGSAGSCYTLDATSGDTLLGYLVGARLVTVYDATGAQVCFDDQGTCALTGTGPYRVLVDDYSGTADPYSLELNDITDPTGCAAAAQLAYGSVPDESSADRCRTLTVTTAGSYQISAVSQTYSGISATLYNPDSSVACNNVGSYCDLGVGTYDLVLNEYPTYSDDFGIVFIAADESRGCTATGDTDFATGSATGTFGGLGEELCLNLPTAAGLADLIFDQEAADGSEASVSVVDSTGAQPCAGDFFTQASCTLTGVAPFRVILAQSNSAEVGYKLLVQQAGSAAGCTAWPQSGYGGTWGATVTTSPTSNVDCLTVPASQHATGEMVDYADTTNTEDGGIQFYSSTGATACQVFTTAPCSFTAGASYLAIVSNSGQNQTYNLVRRDDTQSADCTAAPSTTVGGPSVPLDLTSDLDAACYRVSAASTDDLWFDIRAFSTFRSGALLMITNGSGTEVCPTFETTCDITGSTDYQVIPVAYGYAGTTINAHLDTWRVATAAGPAAQCQTNQLTAAGWAPISGTLSESDTAFCATVNLAADQDFDIYGPDSAIWQNGTPWLDAYTLADWGQNADLMGNGVCQGTSPSIGFDVSCGTYNGASGTAVLLVTLNTVQAPMSFSIQGECSTGCGTRPGQATATAVSPASQTASPSNQITITGTNLNLGTQVMLANDAQSASSYPIAEPLSVNAAGTALTVQLDTANVTPGKYDLVLDQASYSVGTPSPGYLPGAYTVTAAPAPADSGFVSVTASRILNTQTGVGAAEARVAADGTVALKVAGVGGVPASGVNSVALELTAVDPAAAGSLVAYAGGATRPGTSDLSFAAGQTATNLAMVPVTNGTVDIYNGSGGAVDLTGDVVGYTSTTGAGGQLSTIAQSQVYQTTLSGFTRAPSPGLGAGQSVSFAVDGVGNVPASGVSAVVLQVTTTIPKVSGSLTVYPDGSARPAVTDESFTAGQTETSSVVVPVAADGKVDVYNGSGAPIDFTVAADGYYAAASASVPGNGFTPLSPVRVLDTRSGLGGAGGTVAPNGIAVTSSVYGVPGIPTTATAVLVNVTVTGAQQAGSLAALSYGDTPPTLPIVDFSANTTTADLVVVPLDNQSLEFTDDSAGGIQVIGDIEGYYTGTPAPAS